MTVGAQVLYVFRHSLTRKPKSETGSELSAEGVYLARRMGQSLNNVDYVCTSTVSRTLETAVAMGYSVDEQIQFGCTYIPGIFPRHAQWRWEKPYRRLTRLMSEHRSTLKADAQRDLDCWLATAAEVRIGRSSLLVSHGGSIEPVLALACPQSVQDWSEPFHHCEGVELLVSGSEVSIRQRFNSTEE